MIMVTLTKKPKWVCLAVYIRDGISKSIRFTFLFLKDSDGIVVCVLRNIGQSHAHETNAVRSSKTRREAIPFRS